MTLACMWDAAHKNTSEKYYISTNRSIVKLIKKEVL